MTRGSPPLTLLGSCVVPTSIARTPLCSRPRGCAATPSYRHLLNERKIGPTHEQVRQRTQGMGVVLPWPKTDGVGSPPPQAGIAVRVVAQTGLLVIAARDLRRRPPKQVRGAKWLWRLSLG